MKLNQKTKSKQNKQIFSLIKPNQMAARNGINNKK